MLKRWKNLRLVYKFAIAGSIVMFLSMMILGSWITKRIEESVLRNAGVATALYMDSFVAPLIQELAEGKELTSLYRSELDRVLAKFPLSKRVISIKIWKEGGYIAYSSRPSIIGKTFLQTENLMRAWKGVVTAEYDALSDDEDALERASGKPLLEIYAPIRARHSNFFDFRSENRSARTWAGNSEPGKIIAVVEFYEEAENLKLDLQAARLQAWYLVFSVWISTFGILFVIVRQGSQTIDMQQRLLEGRIDELSNLLEKNDQLRIRVEYAYRQAGEINENLLKRIGADLHDGPAQLLGLAILRLESLKPSPATIDTAKKNYEIIKSALSDSMSEIRDISSDLITPNMEQLSLSAMLKMVIDNHKARTGTEVDSEIQIKAANISQTAKINIYRYVQETLNNAFKHANGKKQKVVAQTKNGVLIIQVSDKGPGFNHSKINSKGKGLGLVGIRNRIESLMGNLDIKSGPGIGTCITASFDLEKLSTDQSSYVGKN